MNVEREEKSGHGTFYVELNGHWGAEMAYGMKGNDLIIYHTEVSEELKGQHIATELVAAGVTYARNNSFKIIPLCPFAKAIIHKTAAFQDVLAPAYINK